MLASMRLRLLTANIWGLPWPVGRDLPARLRAIAAALPDLDVDVAAFQEVWTQDARDSLIAAGRDAGLDFVWHRPSTLSGSGLLVLTRLPILEAHFELFSLGGFPERIDHADYYGGKGFGNLTLDTQAGPVSLFVTHLQASYVERDQDEYVGHRTAQVVDMAAALARVRNPVVVLGDLNFEEAHEEHSILTGLTSLRDAAIVLDQRENTALISNSYRTPQFGSGQTNRLCVHTTRHASVTPPPLATPGPR